MRHPAPPVGTRLAAAALAGAGVILAMSGAALVAQAAQAPSQPPSASQDVFAFVRALDEAAARGVWPGFSPSGIPVALYDGEHTVLLRHPSPPPEFSPTPGRPGVLIAKGRHPAVTGNSTREIGGVRTATVIATPAQPVERTMLAVVEEVFHVFWLARHPSFRPNEMARYAYPSTMWRTSDTWLPKTKRSRGRSRRRALATRPTGRPPRSPSAGNVSRDWLKTFAPTRRRWK